jgi:hypothetical protein
MIINEDTFFLPTEKLSKTRSFIFETGDGIVFSFDENQQDGIDKLYHLGDLFLKQVTKGYWTGTHEQVGKSI